LNGLDKRRKIRKGTTKSQLVGQRLYSRGGGGSKRSWRITNKKRNNNRKNKKINRNKNRIKN
jgi:hypothetical protein